MRWTLALLGSLFVMGCGDDSSSGGGGTGATSGGTASGPTTPTANGSGATMSNGASMTTGAMSTGASMTTGSGPSSGTGTNIGDCPVFLPDSPWNTDVSGYPLLDNSDAIVDHIGRNDNAHPDFGSIYGIPYTVVPGTQPLVPVSFEVDDESDPGPYPIPPDVPVEGSSDAHALVIDGDACVLYEIDEASTDDGGASWQGYSGAVWDLKINSTRPAGWTSADAAGLPIFPGLARYDEVITAGVINHALRMTVDVSRRAYIPPATHWASSNTDDDAPPMGLRFRMKANYDCSGYSAATQVICTALKKYGMIVADNGSNWYITGAPDSRWNDDDLSDVNSITGDAFEAVYTADPVLP